MNFSRSLLPLVMLFHAFPAFGGNTIQAVTLKASRSLGGAFVEAVRVTPLVTTVSDYNDHKHIRHSALGHHEVELDADPLGHEGWSSYVEIDYKSGNSVKTRKILVDVGSKASILVENAKQLKVSLKEITDVYLTHWHYDHVQGLPDLIKELSPKVVVHVQKEIFALRKVGDKELRWFLDVYDKLKILSNVTFIVYDEQSPLYFQEATGVYHSIRGVTTTGEVPRHFFGDEESYPKAIKIAASGETDTVKDDQSLVIQTSNGPVVITGCSHAGIRNILAHIKNVTSSTKIHAVVGGLHFFSKELSATPNSIESVARDLINLRIDFILAGHCSGTYYVFELAKAMGATCENVALASVASQFLSGKQPVGTYAPTGQIIGGQFTTCAK